MEEEGAEEDLYLSVVSGDLALQELQYTTRTFVNYG